MNGSAIRQLRQAKGMTLQELAAQTQTTAGYLSTGMRRGDIRVKNSKARYAFYPVWILNTTWRGKKYTFAMNGQTGKFVGDLPIDKSLRWKWHAIYGLGFSALAFVISFFFLGI